MTRNALVGPRFFSILLGILTWISSVPYYFIMEVALAANSISSNLFKASSMFHKYLANFLPSCMQWNWTFVGQFTFLCLSITFEVLILNFLPRFCIVLAYEQSCSMWQKEGRLWYAICQKDLELLWYFHYQYLSHHHWWISIARHRCGQELGWDR